MEEVSKLNSLHIQKEVDSKIKKTVGFPDSNMKIVYFTAIFYLQTPKSPGYRLIRIICEETTCSNTTRVRPRISTPPSLTVKKRKFACKGCEGGTVFHSELNFTQLSYVRKLCLIMHRILPWWERKVLYSTVSADAGNEPRTVAILASAVTRATAPLGISSIYYRWMRFSRE
jgi:hypothetical protein